MKSWKVPWGLAIVIVFGLSLFLIFRTHTVVRPVQVGADVVDSQWIDLQIARVIGNEGIDKIIEHARLPRIWRLKDQDQMGLRERFRSEINIGIVRANHGLEIKVKARNKHVATTVATSAEKLLGEYLHPTQARSRLSIP